MVDAFLRLSAKGRRDALGVAADRSGKTCSPPGEGREGGLGTRRPLPIGPPRAPGVQGRHVAIESLWGHPEILRRRRPHVRHPRVAPDLVGADGEALPKTRSEEKRWSSEVRRRLPEWVTGTAQPVIASAWAAERLAASISKARSCSSTMRRRRPARALSRRARRSSSVPARRASPRVCAMSPATRPV